MGATLAGTPEIVEIPSIKVRAKRTVMTDFPQGLQKLMNGVLEEIQTAKTMPVGAPILLYYDEDYNPEKVDLEMAWPVSEPALITKELPGVLAARYVHVGAYDTLTDVYTGLMAWIGEQGYKTLCPMREVYPNDPRTTPPAELITEIIIPVEKL